MMGVVVVILNGACGVNRANKCSIDSSGNSCDGYESSGKK